MTRRPGSTSTNTRRVVGLSLAACALVWSGGPPAEASPLLVASSVAAPAVIGTGSESGSDDVSDGGSDEFRADSAGDNGGLSARAAIIAAMFVGVLVLGLRAVKRQRDEGRRSKFPPIG